MKKILFISAMAISFMACSSDDDNGGNTTDGKNIKITMQATGLNSEEMDYLSVGIAGGTGNPSNTTIWKINGETQNNQMAVGLSHEDQEVLDGQVIVIESITPLMSASGGFQVINFDAPFQFKYKAEVNGEVVINIDETITDSRNEQYQF